MAPQAGLEPATYGLTVRRSTNWTIGELQNIVKASLVKITIATFNSKLFEIIMAPQAGLEPATYGLTVRRSTNWTIGESQIVYDDIFGRKDGSPSWTRTSDIRINSPPFYQLNYWGIIITESL